MIANSSQILNLNTGTHTKRIHRRMRERRETEGQRDRETARQGQRDRQLARGAERQTARQRGRQTAS